VCLVTGEAAGANLQEVLRSQHSPRSIRMKRERQIIFMGGVVFNSVRALDSTMCGPGDLNDVLSDSIVNFPHSGGTNFLRLDAVRMRNLVAGALAKF